MSGAWVGSSASAKGGLRSGSGFGTMRGLLRRLCNEGCGREVVTSRGVTPEAPFTDVRDTAIPAEVRLAA